MNDRTADELTRQVGRELRGAARRAGLSQDQVAQKLGISVTNVQRKFAGQSPIKVSELVEFSRVLGVSPQRILEDAESALSQAPANVTNLPQSEYTAEWADEYNGAKAALVDPEADHDSEDNN